MRDVTQTRRLSLPAPVGSTYPGQVESAPRDPDPGEALESDPETVTTVAPPAAQRRSSAQSAAQWLRTTNHSPGLVAFVRRARRLLPGDPGFGDPLSTAGEGAPRAAARAADRLLGDRDAASRELSLGVLQVWQAVTAGVFRRPANPEVT